MTDETKRLEAELEKATSTLKLAVSLCHNIAQSARLKSHETHPAHEFHRGEVSCAIQLIELINRRDK